MLAVQADVTVIGTGSAGYCAAVEAARSGCSVLVLDKGLAGRSGASISAEQIAAVIPGAADGDSPQVHYRDTLASGQGLNDERLVQIMVEEGGSCIARLEEMGVLFKRTLSGGYALDPMNGHSFPRSLYFRDVTGKVMIDTLRGEAQRLGVRTMEDVQVAALAGDGRCVGVAIGLDLQRGDVIVVRARAMVIATGGAGQLYPLTTNPVQCTGDGLCLALKCGAALRDLEFYQSYPISVVSPETLRGFVLGISQFGRLYNARGERFMEKYSPALESATRDVLSQAVASEIRAGNAGPNGGVYLDVTGLSDRIYEEYSDAVRLTRQHGIDLRNDRLKILPDAHYSMGGITINERAETGVAGLFAAGEAAGGIHGANRLGNNSLLDTLVFGMRAGRFAAEYALQCADPRIDVEAIREETRRLQDVRKTNERRRFAPWQIREELQKVMEEKAGIIRNGRDLQAGLKELEELAEKFRKQTGVTASGGSFDRSLADYLETKNLLLLAEASIRAALERRESRGAHYREDYPRIGGEEWRQSHEFVLRQESLVMRKGAFKEGS